MEIIVAKNSNVIGNDNKFNVAHIKYFKLTVKELYVIKQRNQRI